MAVALVLDLPGASREKYDEVVERMRLGGQMAPVARSTSPARTQTVGG